ncbi:uncharacterized protein RAG0_11797 [Rhynchosporium agropyri]|uniref:Uncharacterized protein n=1 Tax=Rhynchosporium agropyri TaxID=914238 RepID=A0A1E1L5X1_9HELO|nr:uncharacterized protein RAG0_11797 [Rhynchosporium agropyri]
MPLSRNLGIWHERADTCIYLATPPTYILDSLQQAHAHAHVIDCNLQAASCELRCKRQQEDAHSLVCKNASKQNPSFQQQQQTPDHLLTQIDLLLYHANILFNI